jgi:chromosome transmission fidelity protein 4
MHINPITQRLSLELAIISRSNWSKSATFTDDACSGPTTALAMSSNGVYLASASKSGLFIWATQSRRLVYR